MKDKLIFHTRDKGYRIHEYDDSKIIRVANIIRGY